jgi:hypothetical protein
MFVRAFLFILFTIALIFVKAAHAEPSATPVFVFGTGGSLERASPKLLEINPPSRSQECREAKPDGGGAMPTSTRSPTNC